MLLFDLYRRLLMIVCAVYAAVRMCQAAVRWYYRLSGGQKYRRIARGYLVASLLSMRFRRFWKEILQIVALGVLLGVILCAHWYVM